VFDIADLGEPTHLRPATPYACRSFYKISLLRRHSRAEYADQVIDIEPDALVFSTPKVSFQ
jgi:AraC family transcriptional activator of pobA